MVTEELENKIMEKLCYIRVSFKRAIKKGYPIYYHEPYPIEIRNTPINKELTRKDYTYKYDDGIFDINGKSNPRSYYLYSKIPLIYSNIGYWIIVFIMSLGLAFLTHNESLKEVYAIMKERIFQK